MNAKGDSKLTSIWTQILRFKRSLKLIAFVIFVALVAEVLFHTSSRPRVSEEALIEAKNTISNIERDNGITVRYQPPYTLADGSPPAREGRLITYDPLDLKFLTIVAQSLEKAVTPYPEGFLKKHCSRVFFTGNLEMNGTPLGGTYGPSWVLVSMSQDVPVDEKIRARAILNTFHHECASQIYDKDAWAILGFMEMWPEGMEPLEFFSDEKVKHLPAPDPSSGFLRLYAMTNSSNDFSIYAEHIFAQPKKMRDLALQYPMVRTKLNIVMASYERADPRFKDYFDAQGLRETNK